MLITAINTARCAGFSYLDLAELMQRRLEFYPYPARDVLAGRILQSRNVVEVVMIKLVQNGFEAGFQSAKVHDPA